MSSYGWGGPACVPALLLTFFPSPHSGGSICNGMRWGGWAGDACAAVLGARGPFLLRTGGLAGFWWSHCCLGGLHGVACWLGSGMRCCGSGLPGQLQPSGHEYGAKVLKEEKGAKGLEGEKGASPVWGWFCSGGFFRPPFGVAFGIGSVAGLGKEGTVRCWLRSGALLADAVARLRAGSAANTTRKR